MIRFAYASPIPGSVFSWSAVAVLMSIRSGAGAGTPAITWGEMGATFDVPAPVLSFIAKSVTHNGRDLEGAVNRLLAHT